MMKTISDFHLLDAHGVKLWVRVSRMKGSQSLPRFRFIQVESYFLATAFTKNIFNSFTRCLQNRTSIQLSSKKSPEGPTTGYHLFSIRRQGPNNPSETGRGYHAVATVKKTETTLWRWVGCKIEDRAEKKNPVHSLWIIHSTASQIGHLVLVEGLSDKMFFM